MPRIIHHWKTRQAKARGGFVWQVTNGRRDVVAVVYTGQADAELMADAPKLLGELKHMVAIARMREGELRVSERAALNRARDLIAAH